MSHAITIGDLLLSIGAFAGLVTAAFGLLATFAAGMSDATDTSGKGGCIAFACGVVLCIGCVIGLAL